MLMKLNLNSLLRASISLQEPTPRRTPPTKLQLKTKNPREYSATRRIVQPKTFKVDPLTALPETNGNTKNLKSSCLMTLTKMTRSNPDRKDLAESNWGAFSDFNVFKGFNVI